MTILLFKCVHSHVKECVLLGSAGSWVPIQSQRGGVERETAIS